MCIGGWFGAKIFFTRQGLLLVGCARIHTDFFFQFSVYSLEGYFLGFAALTSAYEPKSNRASRWNSSRASRLNMYEGIS